MFENSSVDLAAFIELAFATEGTLEAADEDDELARRLCEDLVERIKKEMEKLPPN